MEHEVTLIGTVAMGVLAELVCGFAARRIGFGHRRLALAAINGASTTTVSLLQAASQVACEGYRAPCEGYRAHCPGSDC